MKLFCVKMSPAFKNTFRKVEMNQKPEMFILYHACDNIKKTNVLDLSKLLSF